MTYRSGSSTTLVRDIFGDEIPHANEDAPMRQEFSSVQQAARPTFLPDGKENGISTNQLPPYSVNYTASDQIGTGKNSQEKSFFVPNSLPVQHGLRTMRKRSNVGAVLATATALIVGTGAVGGTALFGHKILGGQEALTMKVNDLGQNQKQMEDQIRKLDAKPVPKTQEQMNLEIRDKLEKSTVYLRMDFGGSGSGVGTGFVIDKQLVLTDNHCVNGASRVFVSTMDSDQLLEAKVIRTDPLHDTALLYVYGLDAPALALSKDPPVKSSQA